MRILVMVVWGMSTISLLVVVRGVRIVLMVVRGVGAMFMVVVVCRMSNILPLHYYAGCTTGSCAVCLCLSNAVRGPDVYRQTCGGGDH